MLIATDPLSLVFIACFLFGLLFLLATSLLGNLGHGHSSIHGASQHVGGLHMGGHPGGNAPAHPTSLAGAHAPGAGHAGSTHAPAGSQQSSNQASWLSYLSFINPTTVVFFLAGFGFLGYVFHNTTNLVLPLILVFAALGGVLVALLILLLLSRIFGDTDVSTEQDVSDRTGLLGKVSITIPEHSFGEIIYISPGGMRKSITARSTDGRRIERGQEVVVVNYQRGIAEVDTWERFMNEEGLDPRPSNAAGAASYAQPGREEDGLDPNTPASNEDELAKLRALLEGSDLKGSELALQNDLQKE